MRIRLDGPDHSVGDRECRACNGEAWPKRHFNGFRIGDCDGLVHYELIPRSSGTPEVIHRCDSCGKPLNRWGFEEAAWEAAKREAKEVLAERAKRREMITYAEFFRSIQAIRIEKRGQLLRSFLFEISWEEYVAGRGMLAALVGPKTGSLPDPVVGHLVESLGLQIKDFDTFWIQELNRIFEACKEQPLEPKVRECDPVVPVSDSQPPADAVPVSDSQPPTEST